MKKKELRKLASQIAEAEMSLSKSTTSEEKRYYREEIMRLGSRITSLEDIMLLDELIQEKINEKSS